MKDAQSLEPEEWRLWHAWMRAQRLLARELERGLKRDCDISKAEFSVLVTLWQAADRNMRVGDLAKSLDLDKGSVSNQLTRMEKRGLVERVQYGADGRRAGVGLTAEGRRVTQSAIGVHGGNIRRHFLDALTSEQASIIRTWSEQAIDRLEPHDGEVAKDAPET